MMYSTTRHRYVQTELILQEIAMTMTMTKIPIFAESQTVPLRQQMNFIPTISSDSSSLGKQIIAHIKGKHAKRIQKHKDSQPDTNDNDDDSLDNDEIVQFESNAELIQTISKNKQDTSKQGLSPAFFLSLFILKTGESHCKFHQTRIEMKKEWNLVQLLEH